MVFITKNVAVAALLVAPVIAAPFSQTLDLERRGDFELEERGAGTGMIFGAAGALTIAGLWGKMKTHFGGKKDDAPAAPAPPAEARDFVGGELEERGAVTNIAVGAGAALVLKHFLEKFHHHEGGDGKGGDAPPVGARDLVDFIYAREVLNRARALERRNALEDMIDELD
ncbi:hypothetical protein D9611_010141 [Ephemerocybe angulata]|uniref:Uncharacterized protein n=1 Tax=Ephemerocybe angulata TaxID=980116 RepID=A0A8H5AZD3_9AGAR|nr:hypothetical protein D9611_010141 [Tulosesus angulatus]